MVLSAFRHHRLKSSQVTWAWAARYRRCALWQAFRRTSCPVFIEKRNLPFSQIYILSCFSFGGVLGGDGSKLIGRAFVMFPHPRGGDLNQWPPKKRLPQKKRPLR